MLDHPSNLAKRFLNAPGAVRQWLKDTLQKIEIGFGGALTSMVEEVVEVPGVFSLLNPQHPY